MVDIFFQTQMAEVKHLNHLQITDFSDVLIITSSQVLPSAALVWTKRPHLSLTESQADEICWCLFIKKRSCQINLFYLFYDPVINQHNVSEESSGYHIFDSWKFLTLSTWTFLWVKIDGSSPLNWQKTEDVDIVGTCPFLFKSLGYDFYEQKICLKTAEYVNTGTGWSCFSEHDQRTWQIEVKAWNQHGEI